MKGMKGMKAHLAEPKKTHVMFFVAFMLCLIVIGVMSAQAPVPGQFRSSSDIVEVYATVKLKNGAIVHDMTKDNFELLEDGKPREITVFSRSIQPLSVALVLDHSGSTAMDFDNVTVAAGEFIGHLIRGDRAAVSTLVWDCHGFTTDIRALLITLRMELPVDWGSPIWAATDRAMSALTGEGGRRIVLLLSDGQDNQQGGLMGPGFMPPPADLVRNPMNPCAYAGPEQFRSAKDVIARADREAIMVYTVSVGFATGELDTIAKRTGASHQTLGKYSELTAAFRSIADELHLQYVLGFVPSFTDGKLHKIEVRTKRPGVTIQARKGYVAAIRQP
jgi:Ca-activated chloride channel homolog